VKKVMEFVPFGLVGYKQVGNIVDIGDRGCKHGQDTVIFMIVHGTAATGSGNSRPIFDLRETSLDKNIGNLTNNYFAGAVNAGGEAKERINKSGNIDLLLILTIRMEDGLHLEMGIGEGIDGDFEGGFESGAVGADMEVDGIDGGHRYMILDSIRKIRY